MFLNIKYNHSSYCKYFILFFYFIPFHFLFAQKQIDNQLVGVWSTTILETRDDSTHGKWLINRKSDGEFVMYFEIINNLDTVYVREEGSWWIEQGYYFEKLKNIITTGPYIYSLNEDKINFKWVKSKNSLGFKSKRYSEIKADYNQIDDFEEKCAVYKAKSIKNTLDYEDYMNGFSYGTSEKNYDDRFVGVWISSREFNLSKNTKKQRGVIRYLNGNSIYETELKKINRYKNYDFETGKWWVVGDKLYEYNEDKEKLDVYNFEFLSKDKIKLIKYNHNESNPKDMTSGETIINVRKK